MYFTWEYVFINEEFYMKIYEIRKIIFGKSNQTNTPEQIKWSTREPKNPYEHLEPFFFIISRTIFY